MSKTSLTMYNTITKSIKLRGYITLLALIFTISLQAQNITVKGVVVDETDTPLIGATVMVKGASTGAITDFDGNFTLTTSKGSIISFSYIGYKTQEIKYTGQSINPEILELSDEKVELYEGCLSFPGHNGAISRSKHVKVKAQDRHGEWFEMEADDMLARCIQHENNHLDGITIMDLATHFYEDDYPEEDED